MLLAFILTLPTLFFSVPAFYSMYWTALGSFPLSNTQFFDLIPFGIAASLCSALACGFGAFYFALTFFLSFFPQGKTESALQPKPLYIERQRAP